MSRPDQVVDEGRFRAVAAAALDGVEGVWGTTDAAGVGDLLCVALNASGELVLADLDSCDGVIFVPEGRAERFRVTEVERKTAIGGKTYTVFERAIIAEMETGEDPLTVGDRIFSAAAGGIDTSAAGVYLGVVVPNPITGGLRLILRAGTSATVGS